MSFEVTAWAIRRPIVNKSEKLILVVISDCLNNTTSQCNPSLAYICKFAACSRNCAIAGVKSLEKQGYITVTRQHNKSNAYKLNNEDSALVALGGAVDALDGAVGVPPEVQPVAPEQGSNKEVTRKYSEEDYQFAEFMAKHITPITEHHINLNSWSDTIRLIRERDKKTHNEMCKVFMWANNDTFWHTNVLSPASLRKQYGTLFAKMNQESSNAARQHPSSGQKLSSVDRVRQANDCTDLDREIADAETAEAHEAGMDAAGGDLWPPAQQPVRGYDAGDMDTAPERVLLN